MTHDQTQQWEKDFVIKTVKKKKKKEKEKKRKEKKKKDRGGKEGKEKKEHRISPKTEMGGWTFTHPSPMSQQPLPVCWSCNGPRGDIKHIPKAGPITGR